AIDEGRLTRTRRTYNSNETMTRELEQHLVGLTFTTEKEVTLFDPEGSKAWKRIRCPSMSLSLCRNHVFAVANSCSKSCSWLMIVGMSPSRTVISWPFSRLLAEGFPISTLPRIGFFLPNPGALRRSSSFMRTHCSFT